MTSDQYEECDSRFVHAFNRSTKKSQPLTPQFVAEVKALLDGDVPVKTRVCKKSAPLVGRSKGTEGKKTTAMVMRERKAGIRSEPIIEEGMGLEETRNQISNSILRQCLEEAIQKGNILSTGIPNKFSMMVVQTKKRVYKFKLKEAFQVCYLATPAQELAFEKRLMELAGRPPAQGIAEAEGGIQEGQIIVGSRSGRIL